jgi:hypothetical protein
VIRAIGSIEGRPLVILGLDPQNLNRLREGQPIHVNLRRLNPGGADTELPDIDVVVVFAGKGEIAALVRAVGR